MAMSRAEPMNASPHHSKVKVSLTMSDSLYIAGGAITGKMEVECRADKGLGLGVMMVELFAIEELTSRDHSATSTFLRSKRLFQGHGLPPSNAVLPHPIPGEPPLPAHYYQARKGITTYLFKFPLPPTSPSSINFGSGLATLRYEVRASVGAAWKGERRLVTDKKNVDVVEAFDGDPDRVMPEAVVVGEGGKVWAQGRVVGGVIVAGQGACVELQVKNHSPKKNTGLSITLTRHLHLPNLPPNEKSPLQISDTLTHVAFKGPEYIAQPGSEGVATLVFDVPRDARSLKGGRREDADEEEGGNTEALFEVRAVVGVKIAMGLGSKDIYMELPVTIVHPDALPLEPLDPYSSPPLMPYAVPDPTSSPMSAAPYLERVQSPYAYPALPTSPIPPFMQPPQQPLWYPPHPSQTPIPYQYMSMSPPIDPRQHYFYPPPPMPPSIPPRPSSAEPVPYSLAPLPSGLPSTAATQPLPIALRPTSISGSPQQGVAVAVDAEREEGKGERASRISRHLRSSSRHRSVSPQAHRFALPGPISIPDVDLMRLSPGEALSPNSTRLSASPEILSPRPLPSPKQTVTVDPFTRVSLTKSERVDVLEKLAAEAEERNRDMSADIPKDIGVAEVAVDKTLPGPPVPTGKERVVGAMGARPRVDEVFAVLGGVNGDEDEAPPAPTLHAISPGRGVRSGLDILEQKLLEQVGTRKPREEERERRVDVRSVLPIAIPSPVRPDPVNDSAISSLTLTGFLGGGEEGSRSMGDGEKTSRSLGERGERERRDSNRGSKEKGKERRSGKKKERDGKGRDNDAYKLRKAAKGRVAEWLGRIDPNVPPLVDTPPPSTPTPELQPPADWPSANVSPAVSPIDIDDVTPPGGEDKKADSPGGNGDESDTTQKNVDASPNPRSSGFVPVATYRASVLRSQAAARNAAVSSPSGVSPAAQPKRGGPVSARLPVNWPPHALSDQEVKYDVRSARGGRGGKVAAITQLWANQNGVGEVKSPAAAKPEAPKPKPKRIVSPLATNAVWAGDKEKKVNGAARHAVDERKPKPALINRLETPTPRSPPGMRPPFEVKKKSPSPPSTVESQSLGDLTSRRARMVKSPSVPAILSSSLAKPTLSSTASLVKPAFDKPKLPVRTFLPSVAAPEPKSITKSPPGDLAFGQARLRDLIKKYQGQANS